ncbi:MAG: NADH-ubiquinone oxidoreductase, partial [Deltaproteobacteria bacterium]|nr:NADH-ubiquinone oxidoreductase [Deltaproteobacteria bacterium]
MTPTPWPLLIMAGLLALFYGCAMSFVRRERVDAVILWGGLCDAGLALIGFGLMSQAGATGGILALVYHSLARMLACLCLRNLTPRGALPTVDNLRGAIRRKPVQAGFLVLGIIASFDVSALFTPEGRHYILLAAANDGGLWLAILANFPTCLLTWIAARPILAICFDEPDETRSLPGKDGSRALWLLAAALGLLGLFRTHALEVGAWLAGASLGRLPLLEEPMPWAVGILYAGAFLTLPRRLMTPRVRDLYAAGLAAICFVLAAVSDFPPQARLFSLIVSGIGALIACYSIDSIHNEDNKRVYWFLLLLTFASLLGIVTATNIGSICTFWELMSWASFFLVAWEATDKARAAALKYLVICCGGAYFMFPGLFVLAGPVPVLTEAAASLPLLDPFTLRLALVCVILGAAAKAGLAPLHFWLPDAHPAAPSSVSAPLSGVLTKMGVFAIVLALYFLAGTTQLARTGVGLPGVSWPGSLIVLLGAFTMLLGEWRALFQDDLKRILAYSTMGQIGELVAVLGLGTWLSTTAGLTHALNHAIMKDLLFLGAGVIILRTGSRKLADMAGLARSMPWTVGCMTVGLLALMGLPPFNGFVGKYLMIVACMEAGKPFLAAALLMSGLMGAMYSMRILRVLLLDPPATGAPPVPADPPLSMRLPLAILAGFCLLLGLVPNLGPSLAAPVADMLAGMNHLPQQTLPSLSVDWPLYTLIPMLGAVAPVLLRHDARLACKASAGLLGAAFLTVLLLGRDLDNLSYAMALLAPFLAGLNTVYALGYMQHSHTQWRFYAFLLLMTGGLIGVASSSGLFGFLTFWEIMSSWTLYFAIAHEGTPTALREAFKYFMFNLAGAAFLFLGIGLLVGAAGADSLAGVNAALRGLEPRLLVPVTVLCTAGLAMGFVMKAAQVAIRIDWQMHPAAAPTPVSGFISAALLKIAIFGLIKLFVLFTPGLADAQVAIISRCVAWAGAFTILY